MGTSGVSLPSLRAQRSNPVEPQKLLDCFVASAPRNDEFDNHDNTRLIGVNASATIEQ